MMASEASMWNNLSLSLLLITVKIDLTDSKSRRDNLQFVWGHWSDSSNIAKMDLLFLGVT